MSGSDSLHIQTGIKTANLLYQRQTCWVI